jgi:hypothetical protein
MHVVWHQVSFHYLALFLLRQRVENRAQFSADISEDRLTPSFGHEYNVVLAVPPGVG